MRKKLSLDLLTLALSILLAFITLSVAVLSKTCDTASRGSVAVRVTADSLSAASGTEFPLHVSLTNDGASALRGGSLALIISREPRNKDRFATDPFIVTRSVVKTNVNLAASSTVKFGFMWRVPASLPSGIYRADAVYVQNGHVYDNSAVATDAVFGNSAKTFVTGEATGTAYFIAASVGATAPDIELVNATGKDGIFPVVVKTYLGGVEGKLVRAETFMASAPKNVKTKIPYVQPKYSGAYTVTAESLYRDVPAFYIYNSGNPSFVCSYEDELYPWAVVIGGLGTVMLALLYHRERRHRA